MIILELLQSSWDIAEPLLGFSAMLAGMAYFFRVRWARRRRFKKTVGKSFIIALQVGRPISEAVMAHFGALNCLVDGAALLGRPTLEDQADYQKVAREVYRAVAAHQDKEIKLVLSGPVGLCALIGQLIGVHKFDVHVYQYDPRNGGSYCVLPQPSMDWLR